jgi:hypothetical protein
MLLAKLCSMKTRSRSAIFLVLIFTVVTLGSGCRPSGSKQAGGERTSEGDVAAGAIAHAVPPNNEKGPGSGEHLPPPPLDSARLWTELNNMDSSRKAEFQQRLEAALAVLDANLATVQGFGLEVNCANGDRGLPPHLQTLRDELGAQIKSLPSLSGSAWNQAKIRIADLWKRLEDGYQQQLKNK